MSSGGQIAGAIVGGVVGFVIGGPAGAYYGASLGAAAGAALDPPKGPTVEGPRLSDRSVQTSTYGAFLPNVHGTIAGTGNIIQLENNQLKETVRKQKSGGKGGGGGATTKTYTYSATFQLALCEGPIAGVRRIWCGDKLIYNAGSDNLETIIASNKAAKGFRIYLGTDDQMPDPRYEAEYGVGNVSAHRGMAYIAFYDFQLADYSNTLQAAQFKVEIVSIAEYSEWARNLVKLDTGINFARTTSLGAGRPYIVSVDGIITVGVVGSNSQYLFSLNGDYIGSSFAEYFPVEQNTAPWTTCGKIDGLEVRCDVSVTPGAGPALIIGELDAYQRIDEQLPQSGQIFAVIISNDQSRILVISAPPGINSAAGASVIGATWSLINSSGSLLDSGVVSDEYATNIYTFGFSRAVRFHFASSCFDQNRNTIVSAYSPTASVIIWSFEDGVMYKEAETSMSLNGFTFPSVYSVNGIVYIFNFNQYNAFWANVQSNLWPDLSSVIEKECIQSRMLAQQDIDASEIAGSVRGYRIQGGTIRAALEPLQAAYPFDVRMHGYKIQFLPRGQSSVATIPWTDLIPGEGGRTLTQSREMDTQLPAKTVVSYLDAAREYAVDEQASARLNTEAVNRVDREIPLVLTANEAAGIAEVLQFLPWLERTDFSFKLPPPYRYLEPGDVVTVVTDESTYELRLTEANEESDGLIDCKAKPSRAALYTPNATGAEGVPPSGEVSLSGPSLFIPLDIPMIDETTQNAAGFVGAMTGYTAGWPGSLLVRSSDAGQTFADIQAFAGKSTIGTVRTALSANDGTLIDRRSVIVDVISGELESVTQDQMLNGSNYAAYGADGRWEIVRFENAVLQSDGSYAVSGFIRGDKGTEWATGLHAVGDALVMLNDPDNAFIGMSVDSLQQPRIYRAVSYGDLIDDASDISFTYKGVNLECLSPVYAKASRDGSSNLAATFTRRSRVSSSWWATGVVAPVGEDTEAYEIDVMDGSTVVRTITSTSQAFSYSAANQTTDFGSPQSAITFRIYQLSAVAGRGYPMEVTL